METIKELKKTLSLFPKVDLCANPTPIHRLNNLEKKTGHYPIYIKRDDLNGIGVGGNKLRNLEYLLGDALLKKANTIIVSGKEQSNLCQLAVASCKKLGIECIVVHNDAIPDNFVGNALLNQIMNADVRYIGNVSFAEREDYIISLEAKLIEASKNPYIIHNGASTPTGSLGYVEAAAEIYEQILRQKYTIKNICVPGGNGGLAAGIIYGTGLLHVPYHIDLITVEHEKDVLRQIITELVNGLIELTGVPLKHSLDEIMTIHDAYRGEGWGIPEEKAVRFISEFAELEGIFVEKVYTSKTLYGMVDLIKQDYFESGVCFLHSGGLGTLFSQFK